MKNGFSKKNLPVAIISVLILSSFSVLLFFPRFKIEAQSGWLSGWDYRKQITIDSTKIDDVLTNFPVLVKLSSSNFDFSKARSDGYDIRFTSSDGTTLLKYERERHDSENSLAEYWVKILSVSGSVDTNFYIYYGKSDATDGAEPTNVWSNSFIGVWHLKDDPNTSTVQDSTTTNADGVKKDANQPIEAAGNIAKGQDFDGTDDTINCGDIATIDGATALTVSAWIKTDNTNQDDDIAAKVSTHTTNQPLLFWRDDVVGAGSQQGNTDALSILVYDGDTMAWSSSPTGSLGDTNWHYVGFTFEANVLAGLKPYVDGVNVNNASTVNCNSIQASANNFVIGAPTATSTGTLNFDGMIDEVRVSNIVRSAAWIKADYNSGGGWLVNYGEEEEVVRVGMESSNYRILTSDINVGGTENQTSTIYKMADTIGGIATGISDSDSYKLKAGYRPMQEVYIAVSAPEIVVMVPALLAITGGTASGTASINVITDSLSGYKLELNASTLPALKSSNDEFPDYPRNTPPDYNWDIGGLLSLFGFTPWGQDMVQRYRYIGNLCDELGGESSADHCWDGFEGSTKIEIARAFMSNHPSGTNTNIKYRAEIKANEGFQTSGDYQAIIRATATAN